MSVALLFAGQGMERPHMGLALAARFAPAEQLLAQASAETGVDLPRLIRRGGPALDRTEVLQPALVAVSLGAALALRQRGISPTWVAGHSLGELAAWAAADAIPCAQAVSLAAWRGRLMASCARAHPGGLLAVLEPRARVDDAIDVGNAAGWCAVAAHNAPQEWVVSGSSAALAAIRTRYRAAPVRSAGPWHTPRFAAAAESFRTHATRHAWREPRAAVIAGRSGRVLSRHAAPPEALAQQLTSPVRWADAMATLRSLPVRHVCLLAPSRVLRGLWRKNVAAGATRATIHCIEDADDIERVAAAIAADGGDDR